MVSTWFLYAYVDYTHVSPSCISYNSQQVGRVYPFVYSLYIDKTNYKPWIFYECNYAGLFVANQLQMLNFSFSPTTKYVV